MLISAVSVLAHQNSIELEIAELIETEYPFWFFKQAQLASDVATKEFAQ